MKKAAVFIAQGFEEGEALTIVDILRRLVKDLLAAPQAAVFGLLKGETAAMNLQSDLVLLGKPAVTKVAFKEQMEYLAEAPKGVTVVVFSYTGIYFDYGLRPAPGAKLWFITGNPEAGKNLPGAKVLSFSSKQDLASHPYQLQLVASLIAQRYAALGEETNGKKA